MTGGATDREGLNGPRFLVGSAMIGLAGGTVGGLLGVGGGVLMVPLITMFLGLSQHRAHATSITAIVPIAVVGALVFGEAQEIHVVGGLLILITSMPAARLGASWMRGIREGRLQIGFGVLLLVMGLLMLLR